MLILSLPILSDANTLVPRAEADPRPQSLEQDLTRKWQGRAVAIQALQQQLNQGRKAPASQRDLDWALFRAAIEGRLEEIRSLLDRGANIDAVGAFNYTPLHLASINGRYQCIELLLDRHANIDAVDDDNNTPLHRASGKGHQQCIELLLDRGANINAVDGTNSTPLHRASMNGHHQCVELLIDRGADKLIKNVREDGRDSLLHLLLIYEPSLIQSIRSSGRRQNRRTTCQNTRDCSIVS